MNTNINLNNQTINTMFNNQNINIMTANVNNNQEFNNNMFNNQNNQTMEANLSVNAAFKPRGFMANEKIIELVKFLQQKVKDESAVIEIETDDDICWTRSFRFYNAYLEVKRYSNNPLFASSFVLISDNGRVLKCSASECFIYNSHIMPQYKMEFGIRKLINLDEIIDPLYETRYIEYGEDAQYFYTDSSENPKDYKVIYTFDRIVDFY